MCVAVYRKNISLHIIVIVQNVNQYGSVFVRRGCVINRNGRVIFGSSGVHFYRVYCVIGCLA
jgi:hypothetical protein